MISNIKKWFEQAKPQPTVEDACVQIGCHYEEIDEMCRAFGDNVVDEYNELADLYKQKEVSFLITAENARLGVEGISRIELLDALCDQIVTAVGVAHMLGMDIEKALEEVNRSNWSKFVDGKPVFNEQGKIAKPESYSPPELNEFV